MAGSRALKNRIKSTKNIRQITRAMEAVSAVKMRRSVALALESRPYALAALRILENIHAGVNGNDITADLMTVRPKNHVTLLVVTSDRGLAGAFNTQIFRATDKFIQESSAPVDLVTIGKKARDHYTKRGNVISEFIGAGDYGAVEETRPITNLLADRFTNKETDSVVICYTNFVSALKQEVVLKELLPFTESTLRSFIEGVIPERGRYANVPKLMEMAHTTPVVLSIEPSPAALLDRLLNDLLAIEIHQAILEANASEHSSRMMAMKNASENAAELTGNLTILYNKARQAKITKELLEITAGNETLNN